MNQEKAFLTFLTVCQYSLENLNNLHLNLLARKMAITFYTQANVLYTQANALHTQAIESYI